jgi:hypothetical protein
MMKSSRAELPSLSGMNKNIVKISDRQLQGEFRGGKDLRKKQQLMVKIRGQTHCKILRQSFFFPGDFTS